MHFAPTTAKSSNEFDAKENSCNKSRPRISITNGSDVPTTDTFQVTYISVSKKIGSYLDAGALEFGVLTSRLVLRYYGKWRVNGLDLTWQEKKQQRIKASSSRNGRSSADTRCSESYWSSFLLRNKYQWVHHNPALVVSSQPAAGETIKLALRKSKASIAILPFIVIHVSSTSYPSGVMKVRE